MMTRFTRHAISTLAIAAVVLAACGGDDDDEGAPTPTPGVTATVPTTPTTATPSVDLPTDTTAAPAASAPAPAGALVALGETDLGPVLVAADGLTLYLFTPDADGVPTCVGPCAGTWPPYLVDDGVELTAGEGLDAGLLSTIEHPDGGTMLVYGDWPLYYYAADQAPGDVEGQGVNDVWWVIDAAGAPTTD